MADLKVQVWREGFRFVARCLPLGVVSEGASQDEALENLRRGLALYLDGPAPDLVTVPFLGVGP